MSWWQILILPAMARPTHPLMLAMLMATTVSAQLAPLTDAPLTAHMAEVNAQWPHMLPDPPDGDRTVRFRDEADRIATHLHRVRTELLARTPLDLPPAQARRRIDLLQRLGTYADARTFPQNHVLPHRNPIFIDPYGTACAVGWLMIESGHGDLAQRIDAVMETGYLAEILADARLGEEVFAWAVSHGFTADELAWIQPAYAPATPVSPLGGGTNGPVRVLLPLNNGHLLVAGTFTQAGTTAAQNVAVWDGSTYHALGAASAARWRVPWNMTGTCTWVVVNWTVRPTSPGGTATRGPSSRCSPVHPMRCTPCMCTMAPCTPPARARASPPRSTP